MTSRRLPGRILALTPGDLRDGAVDAFATRARAAIRAGLDSILVREPELSDRATLDLARGLRAELGPRGWLGIHDRVHLAAAAAADGVHLGYRSLALSEARAVCAEPIAIGFSAHAPDDPAAWSGADYLVFGPVFPTPSKRGVLEPVGVEGLARAARSTSIPIWALGGIEPANAGAALAAGARGIAVRGALLAASDPAGAWRSFAPARD